MPTGLDVASQVEAADAPDRPTALNARPRGKTHLGQQRSARRLALRDRSFLDLHRERVATGRLPPGQIDCDRPDPTLGMRLVELCVADLPPDSVSVIDMRRALALQPGDL